MWRVFHMNKDAERIQRRIKNTISIIGAVILLVTICFVEYLFLKNIVMNINNWARYFFVAYSIFKSIVILNLVVRDYPVRYKLVFTLFIIITNVAGLIVYFVFYNPNLSKKDLNKLKEVNDKHKLDKNEEIYKDDEEKIIFKYIENTTNYPICKNTSIKYLNSGEDFFTSLKKELQQAKKYILIDFFIISKSKLWDEIFDILCDRVRKGVRVEIVVDYLGLHKHIPKEFKKNLEENNIKLYIFNPISLNINKYIKFRSHKKVVVIDGKIGYTGGINIADEYINEIEKYGKWKDFGVRVEGDVVKNYLTIILRQIEYITNQNVDDKFYLSENKYSNADGYITCFLDGPDNLDLPTQNLYSKAINSAQDYVYMISPYLKIDQPLMSSITSASKSNIEVKIILPHIRDKMLTDIVRKSYYEILIKAGVKIYEYTPGFIHSKILVSDDKRAIMGSSNLNYLSINFCFECINYTYKTGVEEIIRDDFNNLLKECTEITIEDIEKKSKIVKVFEKLVDMLTL